MDTPEYYHGVTLLVLLLWPLLNTLKGQHAGVKGLIIVLLGLGVFEMTDHAAKLALVLGLIAWAITYLNPQSYTPCSRSFKRRYPASISLCA